MFPWNPGEDIVLGFADKTGRERDLVAMLEEMNAVALRYGFRLLHSGTEAAAERYYVGLHGFKHGLRGPGDAGV